MVMFELEVIGVRFFMGLKFDSEWLSFLFVIREFLDFIFEFFVIGVSFL